MKNINDFYESLLADIDDTINNGEQSLKDHYVPEMLSMFKGSQDWASSKYKDVVSLVGHNNIRLQPKILKELLLQCAEYDGKVLTINLDKLKEGHNYSINLWFNEKKGEPLPPIKLISSKNRGVNKDAMVRGLQYVLTIHIPSSNKDGKDNIDLSKYIHPDSNIESLKIMGYSYNGIISNKIPCTVRELVEYNTTIEKIDKKHWPACSIKLTKKTQQFMVCSQIINGDISTVMKLCNQISSDHVGGTIVI